MISRDKKACKKELYLFRVLFFFGYYLDIALGIKHPLFNQSCMQLAVKQGSFSKFSLDLMDSPLPTRPTILEACYKTRLIIHII